MMQQTIWRDSGGYLWELVEPAPDGGWGVGAKVRDLPDALSPGNIDISEGVREITHWDPGHAKGSGIEIATQMTAPSRAWYLARKGAVEAQRADAMAASVAAQAEVGRIDAMEAGATTVDQLKLLNAPEGAPDLVTGEPDQTPYEKRAEARRLVAQIDNVFIPSADTAIADADATIAAVDSLGRDFIPIPEVAAEKERLAP